MHSPISPPSRAPFDAIVMGAGSAGATAARFLAELGISTLLVDRRPREKAGAHWTNGVEPEVFSDLGFDAPPSSFASRARRFITASSVSDARASTPAPLYEIHMSGLNEWLLNHAEESGATLLFETRVKDLGPRGTPQGGRVLRVGDDLWWVPVLIDASGLNSEVVDEHLQSDLDLCSAWQGSFAVADPAAARRWLQEHNIEAEDILSFTGSDGGYSILNLSLNDDCSEVSILTGAMHREGIRSGRRIASEFVEETSWIGKSIGGGGGIIPLRSANIPLVEEGLIRVGNAAGQVFPMHGSGVAAGMRAAALAAQACAEGLRRRDTTPRGLWSYPYHWYRGRGAMCALYSPLQYLSQTFSAKEIDLLLRAGLTNQDSLCAALLQQKPTFSLRTLPRALRHGPALLKLAPRFIATLACAQLEYDHATRIPETYNPYEIQQWRERRAGLSSMMHRLARAHLPTPQEEQTNV